MPKQLTVTLSDSDMEMLEQCMEFDHPTLEHTASTLLSFAIRDTYADFSRVNDNGTE